MKKEFKVKDYVWILGTKYKIISEGSDTYNLKTKGKLYTNVPKDKVNRIATRK